jgi:hypothetical protein
MLSHIRLDKMHERHRGLTQPIAAYFGEAAWVCLNRYHASPIAIRLFDDGTETNEQMIWATPDARVLGAWANTTDATEAGACGCLIAGVELLRGHFAVRRAEAGTGADYYIRPTGSGETDLENCLRLEVSGLGAGDSEEVRARLARKVQQVRKGDGSLPALAGVIEHMIRRYVFWWWTCRDSNKPLGRSWARQLGISHTWLHESSS